MTPLAYALIAAAANVAGAAAVTTRRRWSDQSLELLIALSAGFMLSVSLGEIVPQAIAADVEGAALVILAGFVLVHLTQHALVGHFHFGPETHAVSRAVSASALVGLLLHTFVDGVAIASAFAVSQGLGLLVFGAIFLHKLPEGLAISSLTLAAGGSRGAALGAASLLGAATIAGVALTGAVQPLARWGLALAGGVTLYVGASNLIPEFQGKPGWRHNLAFFAGCALYLLARTVARA
ncbi:MAG TPA: ZIP family metal transporter [Gemmatimonadaceae bacterium]|nr:ZIP family metal transporter [Gemmatimonadaceae bacterium]